MNIKINYDNTIKPEARQHLKEKILDFLGKSIAKNKAYISENSSMAISITVTPHDDCYSLAFWLNNHMFDTETIKESKDDK